MTNERRHDAGRGGDVMDNPVLLCIVAIVGLLALEMILNTIIRVVYIWKARQLSDLQKLDKEEHESQRQTP